MKILLGIVLALFISIADAHGGRAGSGSTGRHSVAPRAYIAPPSTHYYYPGRRAYPYHGYNSRSYVYPVPYGYNSGYWYYCDYYQQYYPYVSQCPSGWEAVPIE